MFLFKKVGKSPLAAIIPIVGRYQYYDIFWNGYYGVIEFILSYFFYLFIPKDTNLLNSGAIGYFCVLLFLIRTIISVIGKIKLAKSFGKDLVYAFALVFAEYPFILKIALDKSEYLGQTLRKYNSEKIINRKKIREFKRSNGNKAYMINLYKWRSKVALIACVITLVFAVFAIARYIVYFTKVSSSGDLLKYFTTNANALTALAAACIIPYAIEGIRKKRFSYPKWAQLLHYSGTVCTTITMVFAVFVISQFDKELAFSKNNFILHVICPIAILISFMLVESGYKLSHNDTIISLIPFTIYALVYMFEVFLIGQENGGWEDIYKLITIAPVFISLPLMFMMALGVSLVIRKISNYLNDLRKQKLRVRWPKEATPVEIKIEAYGLGRYMGTHEDSNNVTLPLDILESMADAYGLKQEEISRAYIKGTIDGAKERNIYKDNVRNDLSTIFGTPYRLSAFCLKDKK